MRYPPACATALAVLLVSGCARTTIELNNSAAMRNGAPAPGSFYNSASVQAQLRPNSYFGLFFLGYVVAGAQDEILSPRSSSVTTDPKRLDARRQIETRDCTQPAEPAQGNLRCK